METTFAQRGINPNSKSVRFPELARFGRASNAFWRVGLCHDRRRGGSVGPPSRRKCAEWAARYWGRAKRDGLSTNRHLALSFCLSVISAQTLRVCREIMLQRRLHHLEPNLDIAAGGIGIGTNLVRLLHQ